MIQVAGGVIWNPKKGIVVVNQRNNTWSLPKGHVEYGETILDAAIREVHEETGIPESALLFQQKITEYERPQIRKSKYDIDEIRHITLYLFYTDYEKLSPIDPENPEARWVAPRDVPMLLSHPIDKKEFRRMINSEIFPTNIHTHHV